MKDTSAGTGAETKRVSIVRKGPVAWLNTKLLFDTGILAAITSATGNRTPRREVLAALDMKSCFDYSKTTTDDFWIDFVADLGDGFNATHSIAWLIGRDYVGLGAAGEPSEQPIPANETSECSTDAFSKAEHMLPAGKITIFGGDLVYPYATQTEYEDRTIGPYYAARPWQLQVDGSDDKRLVFSIPGNHDWYDGLGAFVQRFCQPGRWMGCWQVQQRRSYFAIKLPHQTWIWGVDLATACDFDAPQLEYFEAHANLLEADEQVILCVPTPAWIDGEVRKSASNEERKPSRSWESWKKIEEIQKLVDRKRRGADGPRIRAILSGDLHHYSRYDTTDPEPQKTHLITCGGGGAYFLGTEALPDQVSLGEMLEAEGKATFPTPDESRAMHWGVFKLPWVHMRICALLGSVMLALVWFLQSAGPHSILLAARDSIFSAAFAKAFFAALVSSPSPVLLTALVFLGYIFFAQAETRQIKLRAVIAGGIHAVLQLLAAIVIAAHVLEPILSAQSSLFWKIPIFTAAYAVLAWSVPGLIFSIYLLASNAVMGLHWQEVFSSQAIEDWKGFLRIRVGKEGITIYPIGLRKTCKNWTSNQSGMDQPAPQLDLKDASAVQQAMNMVRSATVAVRNRFTADQGIEVPRGTTHLFRPEPPLAPQLIENPIVIAHIPTAQTATRRNAAAYEEGAI